MFLPDIDAEALMARYLLGIIAPEQRDAMERDFSAHIERFEELCAFEDEMILRWHRRELSVLEQSLFVEAYLSNPARLARVEKTGALIVASRGELGRWKAGYWKVLRSWMARRTPSSMALTVATAVAIIGIAVSIPRLPFSAPPRNPAGQRLAVALWLLPGARGNDMGGNNTLLVSAGVSEIWLQCGIRGVGLQREYSAIVSPVDGQASADPSALRVNPSPSGSTVTVIVPAGNLAPGDYLLEVRGRTSQDGDPAPLASRYFRLIRG